MNKPRNYVQKNLYKFCKPVVIPNKKKDAELHKENLDKLIDSIHNEHIKELAEEVAYNIYNSVE